MDHLKHQKCKNKQLMNSTLELENNFDPINIYVNGMNKFGKKELKRREHTQKHLVWLVRLANKLYP